MPRRDDGSSDSDDNELVSPSRIRPTFRRDPGLAAKSMTSPMVTAAARKQLRGDRSDQKSAAEIAAEYRKRMQSGEDDDYRPATFSSNDRRYYTGSPVQGAPPHGDLSLQVNDSVQMTPMPPEDPTHQTRLVAVQRRAIPGFGATPGAPVGIGVKFYPNREGNHVITSVLAGGPAEATRLVSPGDVIVAVDGVLARGRSSEEVKKLIVGREGTSVEILLRKASSASPPPIIQGSPWVPPPRTTQAAQTDAAPYFVEPQSTFSPTMHAHSPPPHGVSAPGSPGTRAGIGIRFGIDLQNNVSIIDVMPGSPAQEEGRIQPGDRVLSVDGVSVMGMPVPQIESIIAGEHNSKVVLHMEGMQDSARRSVAMTRRVHTGSRAGSPVPMTLFSPAPAGGSVPPPVWEGHPQPVAGHPSPPGVLQQSAERGVGTLAASPVVFPAAYPSSVAYPSVPLVVGGDRIDLVERATRERIEGLEKVVRGQSESLARQEQMLQRIASQQEQQLKKEVSECQCVVS